MEFEWETEEHAFDRMTAQNHADGYINDKTLAYARSKYALKETGKLMFLRTLLDGKPIMQMMIFVLDDTTGIVLGVAFAPDANGSRSYFYRDEWHTGFRDAMWARGCREIRMMIRDGSAMEKAYIKTYASDGSNPAYESWSVIQDRNKRGIPNKVYSLMLTPPASE